MEELRSTEILDREILEDARKKAFKILKTADESLAIQNQDWEKKTSHAVDSIRKTYEARLKKHIEEINARLPLDKRRLRSETAETFVSKVMDDFLRGLDREKLLFILEEELSERLKESAEDLAGTKPVLFFSGMSLSEARNVLDGAVKAIGSGPVVPLDNPELKEDTTFKDLSVVYIFPSIVINTKDMKIRVSVENAASVLMKDRRAELAAALLGEEVLND